MTLNRSLVALAGLSLGIIMAPAVTISDANVEEAIREEINKATGEITEADLAKVKSLFINGKNASRLTLPDGLVNLEELDVSRNVLSPSLFNPVRFPDDLESLKIVNLSSNDLPNLDAIQHITSIEVLSISDNGLSKLEIPSTLVNLRELDLSSNGMETFVLQEGFTQLEKLDLSDNNLSGSIFAGPVSFPSDLNNLKVLDLRRNELGTVNIPAGLLSLEELYLENNELGSVNFEGPLPSVIDIIAFNNKIKKLTLPEGMGNLDKLDLFGNQITELTIQDGLNEEREPFIDLAENPLEKIIVPEGTHPDLIIYFERFEAEIVFIPKPLPSLIPGTLPNGDFELLVKGPLGTYTVFESSDLASWNEVGTVVNEIGEIAYTSSLASHPAAFYRVERVPDEDEDE